MAMIPELIYKILTDQAIRFEKKGDFDDETIHFILENNIFTFKLETQQLYISAVNTALMENLITEINQRLRNGYFELTPLANGQVAQWVRDFSVGI